MKDAPFKILGHARYNLRDWLQDNFPFVEEMFGSPTKEDISLVERRAQEVYEACKLVETSIHPESAYIGYYAEDWPRIEEAYLNQDYKALALAMQLLKSGIDWE